jgi:hypothetical protein
MSFFYDRSAALHKRAIGIAAMHQAAQTPGQANHRRGLIMSLVAVVFQIL